jgi:hypothetical protein
MPAMIKIRQLFCSSLLLVVLTGCAAQLKSRFVPAGEYVSGQQTNASPSVGSPKEIKVFYGPVEGFTLNEDELMVEKGFNHRILGYIKIVYDKGMCDSGKADKNTVIQALQQSAFSHGANAVLYAHSNLTENPDFWDVCNYMNKKEGYGHGWAVIVSP